MNEVNEKLLEVALQLFIKNGYSDVSTRDIAQAAGVSKGAFYHYFASKDECFNACFHSMMDRMTFMNFSGFPTDSLRSFLDAHFTELRERMDDFFGGGFDAMYGIFTFCHEALKRVPDFSAIVARQRETELTVWTEVITNALASGEIASSLEPLEIARLFICASDGLGINNSLLNTSSDALHPNAKTLWDNLYTQFKADQPVRRHIF
jgi:Transcriptional regulator